MTEIPGAVILLFVGMSVIVIAQVITRIREYGVLKFLVGIILFCVALWALAITLPVIAIVAIPIVGPILVGARVLVSGW